MTEKNNAPPGGRGAVDLARMEDPEAKATTTEEQLQTSRFSRVRQRAGKDKRLNRTDLAVLIALGGYSNREGWCFPGQQAIADDAGTDRRKVDAVVKRLEQFGYLTRVVRRPKATGYWLQFTDDDAPVQAHSGSAPVMTECAPSGASQCAPSGASNAPVQAHEQPIYQPNREQPIESLSDQPVVIDQPNAVQVEALPLELNQFPTAQKSNPPTQPRPEFALDAEQPSLIDTPDDPEIARGLWNELVEELASHPKAIGDRVPRKATSVAGKRRSNLISRLRELGGIGGWKAMLEKIRTSPFLAGQREGRLRVTFDWVCDHDNLTKIMEGNYDQTSHTRAGDSAGDHDDLPLMDQLAGYARSGSKGDG